ncbi:MAG TPA: hypothetical protein VF982_01180 [Anaerolineales bacterium]
MQPYTISQLQTLPLNTVVPAVAGTITQIFPVKSGTSQYGPWTIQSVMLTDGQQTVELKLFDHAQLPPDMIGQSVMVLSGQGKQGPAGLIWQQDTRNWQPGQPVKVQLVLKGKTGATVTLAGQSQGQPSPISNLPSPMQMPAPAPQMAPQAFQQPYPQPQAPQFPQAPQGQPQAQQQAPQKTTTQAKAFVGRNRSLASLAIVALMRTISECEAKYGHFPTELYAPVFNTLLFGASNAGIPDPLPPGLGIEHFDPKSPGSAPDPQPPQMQPPAAQTPQMELERLVIEAGHTFNTLQAWGEETGSIPEAASVAGFSDLPDDVARRLVQGARLVIEGLNAVNPFPG